MTIKQRELEDVLKSLDFRKVDGYFIAGCERDILLGYAIDAPPSSIHIWKFLLPLYDNIEFIHLSLGNRVYSMPSTNQKEQKNELKYIKEKIRSDWESFSRVKTRLDLIEYIDVHDIIGEYSSWVRYITLLYSKKYDDASNLRASLWNKSQPKLVGIVNGLKELGSQIDQEDHERASRIIEHWRQRSYSRFCATS